MCTVSTVAHVTQQSFFRFPPEKVEKHTSVLKCFAQPDHFWRHADATESETANDSIANAWMRAAEMRLGMFRALSSLQRVK